MVAIGTDANDGWVGMLIREPRRYGADTNAQGTDENDGIDLRPILTKVCTWYEFTTRFLTDDLCNVSTSLRHLNHCCFHFSAFSMSMGL